MILNKLIDKAIEAAKQSAMQMYGYDLSELKEILHDEPPGERPPGKEPGQNLLPAGNERKNVTFERTENSPAQNEQSQPQTGIEAKLTAIRAYAARQTETDADEFNKWSGSGMTGKRPGNRGISPQTGSAADQPPASQLYSRKDIRRNRRVNQETGHSGHNRNNRSGEGKLEIPSSLPSTPQGVPYKSNATEPVHAQATTRQKEIFSANKEVEKSLLNRLDRLESLMHLSLSPEDNLSYASHPAFHELLHKGVPRRIISGWFHTVSEQGIHPAEQKELFDAKLSHIIRESITGAKAGSPKQFLLFAGRSGSGKTNLIMKLSRHSYFTENKKIAVVSVEPAKRKGSGHRHYYTILDPYCRDRGISYYRLKGEEKLDRLQEEWRPFDHILMDTPSLETLDHRSFEHFLRIKQKLESQQKMETHYLVNTSVSGAAFNDPLALQVDADHLALTHIDRSDKWGKIIQLLTQTDLRLRFISSGESIPRDLDIFDPEHFTERLLN